MCYGVLVICMQLIKGDSLRKKDFVSLKGLRLPNKVNVSFSENHFHNQYTLFCNFAVYWKMHAGHF